MAQHRFDGNLFAAPVDKSVMEMMMTIVIVSVCCYG
jgi:hypothetical protein